MHYKIGKQNTACERIMDYVIDYCIHHGGVPPTVDQMVADLPFRSKSTIHHYLAKLYRQGRLIRIPGTQRFYVAGGIWIPPNEEQSNE